MSAAQGLPTNAIDPLLVQQTKNEIRVLVQEITQLSRAAIPAAQFYEEFLRRVVSALAACGGAIWLAGEDGRLALEYQVSLPPECELEREGTGARHRALLQNVLTSGQATLVPPRSGSVREEDAGNPTESLLILAALKVDLRPCGVIEIFQRSGGGPTTQRGYLRFLVQMSEVAGEYLRNARLRQLDDRQTRWTELERFIRQVHGRLDSASVIYTIANESRRLIGCDRSSVTVARGRRHTVAAVSGLDSIDRRAADVRLLGVLVSAVCATGRPFWYDGRQRDMAPQIERHLDAYLDRSHATMLAVIPLVPGAEASARESCNEPGPAIGALVIEQFSNHRVADVMVERSEIISRHSASALGNALEHESLFLLPLWKTLGRAKWIVRARTLPKVLIGLGLLIATLAALVLAPADFDLGAPGKLQPAIRRDVFAHTDGVVVDVPVQHEQIVEQGQVLARLNNTEIEVQIADLIGRQRATRERILSLQRLQLDGRKLRMEEQNRLSGELLELREVGEGIERQLQLLREKEEQLVVRSEMRGQVVTWNVGTLLLRRPVQKGQLLMSLLDLDGAWELELYLPERRVGHLGAAAARSSGAISVTFHLASHPERQFTGTVVEIHRMVEVHGDDGNCVMLRVAIDKDSLPELRSETSVTAKVHCGRRCIGFVLFHELMETVQSKILFWM